jgi:hypothetical protein
MKKKKKGQKYTLVNEKKKKEQKYNMIWRIQNNKETLLAAINNNNAITHNSQAMYKVFSTRT